MIILKTTITTNDETESSKIKKFKDNYSEDAINYCVEELINSKDFLTNYQIDYDLAGIFLSTWDEGGSQETVISCDNPKTILAIEGRYRNKQDFFWRFH